MGYAVLHLDKSSGNESSMSDHIERKDIHPNVDPMRVHLSKQLIDYPEGVSNRTEAIEHRIQNAGLSRKVGKNQVKVIRVLLSGSHDDMLNLQQQGKLDDWCQDSIDWLENTYGKENVVSATLHLDEQTPHIHASVVPIVQGERRQKAPSKKKEETKRQYKKKNPNRPRLCCDDVMAKVKLNEYQDSYGEAMSKYGLKRGEKNSDARHITLTEFYRNQAVECKNLQENIGLLLAQEDAKLLSIEELRRKEEEAKLKSQQAELLKQEKEAELKNTEESLSQAKGQLKTEKFKGAAAEVGSTLMDGIGSALGTSKYKRQQKEIETLKHEKHELQADIEWLSITIQQERNEHQQETMQLKQQIVTIQEEYKTAMDKLKDEIKKIYDLFPKVKELLRMEKLLKVINFTDNMIKLILQMKPIGFKGELYSPEHCRTFFTEYSVAEIKTDSKDENKLELLIDDISNTKWFREKQNKFLESQGFKLKQKPEDGKNKGIKR